MRAKYPQWVLEGGVHRGSEEWVLALEPCVGNVMSVLRHYLGVDFTEADREQPTRPWEHGGEAHVVEPIL